MFALKRCSSDERWSMGWRHFGLIALCSLAGMTYMNYSASAGWFGPSNYDECLLDKTSNQMLSIFQLLTIQKACKDLFPPEPRETVLDESGKVVQYSNRSAEAKDEFKICLIVKPDSYAIDRVVGHFAITDNCTYEQTSFTNVIGRRAWFKDTYIFNIQRTFNCSYFSFYGLAQSN
jgi:hypothetical protein